MPISRPFLLLAAGLVATPLSGAAVAMAQQAPPPASEDRGAEAARISVSGEGTATIAPDMAVINLTVLREAETARQALDANSEAMAEVLAAMEEEGIAERDLQTSNFSIDPQYVYPENGDDAAQAPRITGYTVSNSLTVRVRDLENVGVILDRSVSLGVNQGGSIFFTNDDPVSALEDARRDAMEQAMAKARTLTEAAGVSLGRVLDIREDGARPPMPMPMHQAEMARSYAADASVPVAAGENEYRVQVQVTWELAE